MTHQMCIRHQTKNPNRTRQRLLRLVGPLSGANLTLLQYGIEIDCRADRRYLVVILFGSRWFDSCLNFCQFGENICYFTEIFGLLLLAIFWCSQLSLDYICHLTLNYFVPWSPIYFAIATSMTISFVSAPLFVSSATTLVSVIFIVFWTEVAEFILFLIEELLVLMSLVVPQLDSISGTGACVKVSS